MTISDLPNLGERSAEMLAAAGIFTRSQLKQLGPVRAFLAAKQAGTKPSMNLLWAIAGALTDTHWTRLSPEYKQRLRNELEELTSDKDA
jgi:hypothetical protein